jgi:hypothetical protein
MIDFRLSVYLSPIKLIQFLRSYSFFLNSFISIVEQSKAVYKKVKPKLKTSSLNGSYNYIYSKFKKSS